LIAHFLFSSSKFLFVFAFQNSMLTPSQRFLSVRAATQAEGAGGKPNFKVQKIQIWPANYIVVKQYSYTIGTF